MITTIVSVLTENVKTKIIMYCLGLKDLLRTNMKRKTGKTICRYAANKLDV